MNIFENCTNEELLKMHREHITQMRAENKSPHGKEIFDIWRAIETRKGILPTYFRFHDENTDKDYLLPVTCCEREYNDWLEHDVSEVGFVSDMENYGVHDCNSGVDENEVSLGFTSYEVEEDQFPELLEKWKQKLVELGWASHESQWEIRQSSEDL